MASLKVIRKVADQVNRLLPMSLVPSLSALLRAQPGAAPNWVVVPVLAVALWPSLCPGTHA